MGNGKGSGSGSKLDKLEKTLREVIEKYDSLKKVGIDSEILEIYLEKKTRLPRKKVKQLLESIDEFYEKLMKDAILEGLNKNE